MGRRARKGVEGGGGRRIREGRMGEEKKEREIEPIWLISSDMEQLAVSIISDLENQFEFY